MEPVFRIGQRVAVNVGGCAQNRTEGVVRSIKELPQLTTYQVFFPELGSVGVEPYYVADLITAVD
jgi:hypothetical protein